MRFPSAIANGSIGLSKSQYQDAIEKAKRINELKGVGGYFYHHFCDKSKPPRFSFTS